jgi:hypothetical protein
LVGGAAVAASSGKEDVMLQDSPIYAYFPATDVPRARAFYEKKLGLKPKEEVAGGVVYEFGKGTAAFLYETPSPISPTSPASSSWASATTTRPWTSW